jgi:molybdopterin converting factor subunit 1
VTVHLIYFAALRDLLNKPHEDLTLPFTEGTVADLVRHLLSFYPALSMEGVRIAVNEEFAPETTAVHDGDVIALIPPVSGG